MPHERHVDNYQTLTLTQGNNVDDVHDDQVYHQKPIYTE